MSEKTEQPSAKKLRDARRNGQIPRSKVLEGALVTLGGLLGFSLSWPRASGLLRAWTAQVLSLQDVSTHGAVARCAQVLAWLTGPALAGALVMSALVATATAGLQMNPALLAPKPERLNPFARLKTLWSVKQLKEVLKGGVLALVVAFLAYRSAMAVVRETAGVSGLDGRAGLLLLLAEVRTFALRCAGVLVVAGALDYFLARRRHTRELMMTREEVKQEHKEAEGDPHHKAKRKAVHRQLAQGGPARGVQKATAVVVNPTHIAVALRYAPDEAEAPYIVAKAREDAALALRGEAKALGIPVVRDIPLARSLIHYDVGEEIPEELYQAAAAVLRAAAEAQNPDEGPRRRTS